MVTCPWLSLTTWIICNIRYLCSRSLIMLANFTSPIFNYFISIAPENIKGLSRTSERSKLFFHKIFHRGVNTGYLHMGCYIFGCIRLCVWVVLLLWVMGAGAPGLCILCLAGISLMAGW